MKITSNKKGAFGFGALIQTIRNWLHPKNSTTPLSSFYVWLKYGAIDAVKYRFWLFSESFKWHVKCYLMFWRLPKLLEHSLDALEATESMRAEETKGSEKAADRVEFIMEGVVDTIWADKLFAINYDTKNYREESSLSDAERKEIHTTIKEKYEQYDLRCPDEYLTQDEQWDRAEIAHEDNLMCMSGGPDYDERPAVVCAAKRFIKKNKIESRYFGDWGGY